jgi:hypothetical protein
VVSILDELAPLPVASDGLPDHISASQVGMMLRCPEQYRQHYVLGRRERPGSALVWGTADHAAIAVSLEQKIETHEDLPTSDVQDAFVDALDKAVDDAGGPSEVDWQEDAADIRDKGTALVAVYHETVSPRIQPVGVEEPFKMVGLFDGALPVVGRIDVETADSVIDRKTANRAESTPKPQWTSQSLLYRVMTSKPMEWHLSVKPGKSAGRVVTPEEAPALLEPFSDGLDAIVSRRFGNARSLAEHYMATYGPDELWPDGMDHAWACGFCGFRPECSWWA